MPRKPLVLIKTYPVRICKQKGDKQYLEISLPYEWVKRHKIKKGDEVVVGADKFLIVAPKGFDAEVLRLLSYLLKLEEGAVGA